eukprot:PITA_03152
MFSALPTPKRVLQHIQNIQRDFLWGKGEEKKKWALVAWDKLCKPKTHGGLGLHDPENPKQSFGGKTMVEMAKGIRNPLGQGLEIKAKNKGKWRIWKVLVYSEETSTSSGQLRCGRNNKGNFNLKEAKRMALGLDFPNLDKVWKELWQNPHWMKIKLFMWLVQHKKILTWENLRKRGVASPSRCQLYELQEETIEHLLNLYPFTSSLWNWVASIFRQTDRDNFSIIGTLKNWRKNFSENEIINKAWTLVPGFLIWDVWKERNNRIFKNRIGTSQSIIAQIIRELK